MITFYIDIEIVLGSREIYISWHTVYPITYYDDKGKERKTEQRVYLN